MASDINWTKLVGEKSLTDGGYTGDLMLTARAHIADAVKNNEITQAQAGEIYTAMIPSAFQTALAFALK